MLSSLALDTFHLPSELLNNSMSPTGATPLGIGAPSADQASPATISPHSPIPQPGSELKPQAKEFVPRSLQAAPGLAPPISQAGAPGLQQQPTPTPQNGGWGVGAGAVLGAPNIGGWNMHLGANGGLGMGMGVGMQSMGPAPGMMNLNGAPASGGMNPSMLSWGTNYAQFSAVPAMGGTPWGLAAPGGMGAEQTQQSGPSGQPASAAAPAESEVDWEREKERAAVRERHGGEAVARPCNYCGEVGTIECKTCSSNPPYQPTYYCSINHQKLEWVEHQKHHEMNKKTYNY